MNDTETIQLNLGFDAAMKPGEAFNVRGPSEAVLQSLIPKRTGNCYEELFTKWPMAIRVTQPSTRHRLTSVQNFVGHLLTFKWFQWKCLNLNSWVQTDIKFAVSQESYKLMLIDSNVDCCKLCTESRVFWVYGVYCWVLPLRVLNAENVCFTFGFDSTNWEKLYINRWAGELKTLQSPDLAKRLLKRIKHLTHKSLCFL